jgi:hypothetical protein
VPPPVEPCLIDFMKTHRSGVWQISGDPCATIATCVLCTAALEEREILVDPDRHARKRKERLACAVSLTLNLSGRAALWQLHAHESSSEHLGNLMKSEGRLDTKRVIPNELWRNSSFRCAGIKLSTLRAIALSANHVGGCLGMSAVAAFSRRL